MQESEILSALIGEIYDAALDPGIWPDVLSNATFFVGAQGAGLLSRDVVSRSAEAFYTFGVTPHYVRLYIDQYAQLDPTVLALSSFGVGQVVSTTDFLPWDEFFETRFYKEWVRPQSWMDGAQAILDKSSTSFAHVSFLRDEAAGRVNEGVIRRMRLIVPHLRRAVLIGNVIDLKRNEVSAFADTLDGLSAGVFLLDDTRAIVHANASAYAMLASGDVLHATGGYLGASDPKSDQDLRAVLAAAGMGDAAIGIAGIALPLTARDGDRYVAHAMPLTSGARRQAGKYYAAAAVLFVHKAALQMTSAPEAIAKVYSLTPSELRVLLAIVQIGGVPETAEALGIGENTVRTHLQRVFAKTGISRQADLVRLVAGFSNPLVR